eukprot:12114976-Karenia_brevis.AAC.1
MQVIDIAYGGYGPFEQQHRVATVGPNQTSAMTESESHHNGIGPWRTTTVDSTHDQRHTHVALHQMHPT